MPIDQNKKIFVCEDSLEGIFTGVYEAYAAVSRHEAAHEGCSIMAGMGGNFELFAEYIDVKTDAVKAGKVIRTICGSLGMPVYQELCKAAACEEAGKAEDIYKTIVLGLGRRLGTRVLDAWNNPHVAGVLELARRANNEIMHMEGFLRFQELENGMLFSRIGPKNNIIAMLTPHFADRLPNENFMIYDEKRGLFAIHEKQKQWVLVTGEIIDEEVMRSYSEREEYFQALFIGFCRTIAIDARKNLSLQQQMLPLRFQKYMVEFEEKKEKIHASLSQKENKL